MRSPAPAPRTIGLLERPWTWREAGRLCARSARCPMEKLWSVISTATAPRISRRARRAAELERLAMHSPASIRFGSADWIGCASVATSAQRAASSAAVHQVHRGRQREARQQADARGAQRVCRAERITPNPRRPGLVEARLRLGCALAASLHRDHHLNHPTFAILGHHGGVPDRRTPTPIDLCCWRRILFPASRRGLAPSPTCHSAARWSPRKWDVAVNDGNIAESRQPSSRVEGCLVISDITRRSFILAASASVISARAIVRA
jgi:hypothetical protein